MTGAGAPSRTLQRLATCALLATLLLPCIDGLAAVALPTDVAGARVPEVPASADAAPQWNAGEIAASRRLDPGADALPAAPAFAADPMNVTLVVEQGASRLTLLDGDSLEPIVRVPVRHMPASAPVSPAGGRFVYWASQDGWVTKFDLWQLKQVAEARAGIRTHNLAVSADGKVLMVANAQPHTLVALDGRDLAPIRVIPAVGRNGRPSRVSNVHAMPARSSFVAALADVAELWEIPHDGRPVYKGMVHDFQFGEAIPEPGPLPVRAIALEAPLEDFFFDPRDGYLLGSAVGQAAGQVVHLGAGRTIATADLAGRPRLGAGTAWMRQDAAGRPHRVIAAPGLEQGLIPVIDMWTWRPLKAIPTLGPGTFVHGHEQSPYLWANVSSGPDADADALHVIDRQTLDVVATLRPAQGKPAAHVEFDRRGRFAMVSIGDTDGELVVYDTRSLRETRRLPMQRPAGAYNIWNLTRGSRGSLY